MRAVGREQRCDRLNQSLQVEFKRASELEQLNRYRLFGELTQLVSARRRNRQRDAGGQYGKSKNGLLDQIAARG